MRRPEPGIAREIIHAINAAMRVLGFDVERLMKTESQVPMVGGTLADAIFEQAAAAIGDPVIGISIVPLIPIGALGVLDYAACTSATLREALQRLVRYYGVVSQRARLRLHELDGRAYVDLEAVSGIARSRHWGEFSLGMIAARMRQMTAPDLALIEVTFAHPAPSTRGPIDAHFRAPVVFDAAADRLVFTLADLDRPLLTASAHLASVLDQRIQELEPKLAPVDPFVDQVRRALAAMLDERRTEVDELARRLRTSRRSLQRQLAALGTGPKELLDELRRDRAVHLLAQGSRVVDVATALGFADASAFFRAYRRWTGTTPRPR